MYPRIVWLTVWLMTAPVYAQSLSDAAAQAWARHPLAQSSAAREAEARARIEGADRVIPGPVVTSLSAVTDRLGARQGRQEWELEAELPLWRPGQQRARQAEAKSLQGESQARRAWLRLQVAGEVREAWWALAAARQGVALAQHRLSTAQDLCHDVQRRYRAGELARVDANLAQSESLSAVGQLEEAQAALAQAEQSWRALTGLAAPAELMAEDPHLGDAPAADGPGLRAAVAGVELAGARLQQVQASPAEAPVVALRWLRSREDASRPYSHALGVKLSLPWAVGPRVRQDDAAARAELAQAQAEQTLAHERQDQERAQVRREQSAAQRQWDLTRQRHALAEDNLRLTEKSFTLGEADLPTLLRVRGAALEARGQLQRQQLALWALRSRRYQAWGVMP